jgi:hypothetical protein
MPGLFFYQKREKSLVKNAKAPNLRLKKRNENLQVNIGKHVLYKRGNTSFMAKYLILILGLFFQILSTSVFAGDILPQLDVHFDSPEKTTTQPQN